MTSDYRNKRSVWVAEVIAVKEKFKLITTITELLVKIKADHKNEFNCNKRRGTRRTTEKINPKKRKSITNREETDNGRKLTEENYKNLKNDT